MGTVTLTYGNQPRKMVRDLVEETGALDSLRPYDKVMIKPNLVVSRHQWVGVDTDPRVIEAIVIELKERGIHRITVGDGSGGGQSATLALEICGYTGLARKYDLDLIDLEKDRFTKLTVPIKGPFKELEVAGTVLESDCFINVPVMKAHMQAGITCSLKNLKGTMPGMMKRRFHGVDLHRAIAQLNSVLRPDLIVVDGLKGDLYNETGNTPVAMDRMLLGTNPVEMDSVVADTLGYAPRDIPYICHCADEGLGTCDLDQINIHALNQATTEERFTPPPHYSRRFPCHISAEGVCCTCMGNLMFALERLKDMRLLKKKQVFMIGQKSRMPFSTSGDLTVSVGRCAAKLHSADITIPKCPPTANEICENMIAAM